MEPLIVVTLTLALIFLINSNMVPLDVTQPNAPRVNLVKDVDKCQCKYSFHLSHYEYDGKRTYPIYLKYKHICKPCKAGKAIDGKGKEEASNKTSP